MAGLYCGKLNGRLSCSINNAARCCCISNAAGCCGVNNVAVAQWHCKLVLQFAAPEWPGAVSDNFVLLPGCWHQQQWHVVCFMFDCLTYCFLTAVPEGFCPIGRVGQPAGCYGVQLSKNPTT